MAEYIVQSESLTAIADKIRVLSGTEDAMSLDGMSSNLEAEKVNVESAFTAVGNKGGVIPESKISGNLVNAINSIPKDAELPELTNEGSASDLLSGKQLIDGDGNVVTGTIPTKTASNLTASGATVTVPSGYYASNVTKSVATATQATPSISVNSNGLIIATATQTAGYVSAGTKSAAHQLAFQPAKTITPSTASQIAVSSGYYTGGNITVAGDSNLVAGNIKSGVSIFGVSGTLESDKLVDYSENEDAIISKRISGSYTNNRVTNIGDNVFYSCYGLTSVNFPVCTEIGKDAFHFCIDLISVSFPACAVIYHGAFMSCYNLTSVSFPVCRFVLGSAFKDCVRLTTVSFPACTVMGFGAFVNCYNLSQFYLAGSSIPNLSNSSAFTNTPYTGYSASFSGTPYIYVPSSLITTYQSATNWAYFSSYFSAIEDIDNEDTGGEDTGKISFILNGTQYFAETGMSFSDWIESPYNTDGYELLFGCVSNGEPSMLDASTIIENGKEYSTW